MEIGLNANRLGVGGSFTWRQSRIKMAIRAVNPCTIGSHTVWVAHCGNLSVGQSQCEAASEEEGKPKDG